MSDFCLEACVGFLVGTAGACPRWVELDLGRLVGRAVLRDLSGGDCVLRKSLGSLSADEWCCVTAIFVVSPEAS